MYRDFGVNPVNLTKPLRAFRQSRGDIRQAGHPQCFRPR